MKKVLVIISLFVIVISMSVSSFAAATYSHSFTGTKEICRVSSNSGTYNARAYAWVGRLDGVTLGTSELKNSALPKNSYLNATATQTQYLNTYSVQCGKYEASARNVSNYSDGFNVSGNN